MNWKEQIKKEAVDWLLEEEDPGARYLALRDLCQLTEEDETLRKARQAAHRHGPIATILENMNDEGYWVEPGPGYNPKYKSTVWALIFLAQLGASVHEDPRIEQACRYLLKYGLASGGQFTASGAPSGTADCMQGNLSWALLELGYEDPRLDTAFESIARTVTGE
ncbi:MAG: nitrogen fixation protein NifH, partial [Chloroflexi bacterium]